MELIIKEMSLPEAIEFNFDELKQELTDKVSQYTNLVYTDDQIKEAKKDVANLRKFTKALSDERIKIKKQCLKPYETFEAKVKELEQIVNEPITMIDSQVKEYEEQKKFEKQDAIVSYIENLREPALNWLRIPQIWNEKWLNASVSMKSIQEEIEGRFRQIESDMSTLANLPDFGFEALQIYKSTLDLAEAISEGHRLAEIQKEKEAHMAKQPTPVEAPVQEAIAEDVQEDFIPSFGGNEAVWRTYRMELTTDQKTILEGFLLTSGIKYQEI